MPLKLLKLLAWLKRGRLTINLSAQLCLNYSFYVAIYHMQCVPWLKVRRSNFRLKFCGRKDPSESIISF